MDQSASAYVSSSSVSACDDVQQALPTQSILDAFQASSLCLVPIRYLSHLLVPYFNTYLDPKYMQHFAPQIADVTMYPNGKPSTSAT